MRGALGGNADASCYSSHDALAVRTKVSHFQPPIDACFVEPVYARQTAHPLPVFELRHTYTALCPALTCPAVITPSPPITASRSQ
eukprot:9489824-Pyramimonas_sp.AAC.1